MRRCFVHVDDGRNDVLGSVLLGKIARGIGEEFVLFLRELVLEKVPIRTNDKGTHEHRVFTWSEIVFRKALVDVVSITFLPPENVVVSDGQVPVDLRILGFIIFIPFVFFFNGSNIGFVIFLHVAHQIRYCVFTSFCLILLTDTNPRRAHTLQSKV